MKLKVVGEDGKITNKLLYVESVSEQTIQGLANMLEVCIGEGTGGNDASNTFIHKLWEMMYPDEKHPWWWKQ